MPGRTSSTGTTKGGRVLTGFAAGKVSAEEVTARIRGWANHARYGNMVGLRKAVLGNIVLRLGDDGGELRTARVSKRT